MRSYWDTTAWQAYDLAIIGGGIIGISTAISYAERHPDHRVVVLERGHVPFGATTRNAGFACFGSLSEIAHDIDLMGVDAAHDLVRMRLNGLRILMQRCGTESIEYNHDGGSEIFLEDHPALRRIDDVNAVLRDIINEHAFQQRNDLRAAYGLSHDVVALIHTAHEGTLHSGKMLRRLWKLAAERGVEIRTGSTVRNITSNISSVRMQCESVQQTIDIACSNVVVATNAMIPSLVQSPAIPPILPGRGQVLVTEPIPGLSLRGSFHMDEGYYYFRELDGRVLLGGGRNIDIDGEATLSHDTTQRIQDVLEHVLRTVILPHQPSINIEHRWAGTMAFTENKQPVVAVAEPHVIVAFGCNGMGIALGSALGEQCADLLHT
jgi:glycine/D-amino acid oxidase-like deaminating enzyme